MSSSGSTVSFQVPTRDISRRNLHQFARKLQAEVAEGRPFECLITTDEELRRLNQQFRRKDYATDVLSFPLHRSWHRSPTCEPKSPLGEIAISYDRARAQASTLAHTTEQELQILLLHGVLHLTGLDHERDGGEMARIEGRWRKHFSLPSGLIERASA